MEKFRRKVLASGAHLILGKDAESNDELIKKFKGKSNTILHTTKPGSPFGVIDRLKPNKEDVMLSGSIVARYSQAWRDNKSDVRVNVFTGKDIEKPKDVKPGTWKVMKSKTITVKKEDILKLLK